MHKIIFISAIDTDAGKTVTTGLLARYLKKTGLKVITQKIAQTGDKGISQDIRRHREIMNEPLNDYDIKGITCPYVFEYPASPHLSASLEGKTINTDNIHKSTLELKQHFDVVLIEGVGGLHVPLNNNKNVIDYIEEKKYPVILVSHSKLGSINLTLLSLEVLKNRNIQLVGLVYNQHPADSDIILKNTSELFQDILMHNHPQSWFVEIPFMKYWIDIDFKCFFK